MLIIFFYSLFEESLFS